MSDDEKLQNALVELYERKLGFSYPKGHETREGLWVPDETEVQVCCQTVLNTVKRWAILYRAHASSVAHVARLYNVPRQTLYNMYRESLKDFNELLNKELGVA